MPEESNSDPRYWKISPGEGAKFWDEWRERGFVAIGWNDLGDVSKLTEPEFELRRDELILQHEDWTEARLDQVWDFAHINEGDRVVANQGTTKVLGIGTVMGPYEFVPGAELGHRLPVQWDDLTPRQIQEGNWRNTLRKLGLQKFESIQEAPPMDDHSEQQGRSNAGVRAILWKKLHDSDLRTMNGEMRQGVQGGGGQPDLRLGRRLIPNESVLQFVSGTESADVISTTDPLHVAVTQRPLPGTLSARRYHLGDLAKPG